MIAEQGREQQKKYKSRFANLSHRRANSDSELSRLILEYQWTIVRGVKRQGIDKYMYGLKIYN